MDICAEIDKAKTCASKMAYNYAVKAIYGNVKENDFYKLLLLNNYIKTLQRNVPETEEVREVVKVDKVDFSALIRRNNTLILEAQEHTICVKVQKCLSDDEICKIVEYVDILCLNSNCN